MSCSNESTGEGLCTGSSSGSLGAVEDTKILGGSDVSTRRGWEKKTKVSLTLNSYFLSIRSSRVSCCARRSLSGRNGSGVMGSSSGVMSCGSGVMSCGSGVMSCGSGGLCSVFVIVE
jgi:hypothetical protein